MYDELKVYLGAKYIDQARRSLIMLKHIRSIEFQVKDFYQHSKRSSASSIKSVVPLPKWAKKHIHKREQSADLWTSSKGGTRETIWRVSSEMDVESIHRETDDGKQFNQIESFTLDITIDKLDSNPKVEKWLVTKAFIRIIRSGLPHEAKHTLTKRGIYRLHSGIKSTGLLEGSLLISKSLVYLSNYLRRYSTKEQRFHTATGCYRL